MGSRVLPKTAADKELSLKHLEAKIALDKRHAADHAKAAKGTGDTYNNSHAAEHRKSLEANVKQKAAVSKVVPSGDKKVVKANEKVQKKSAKASVKIAKKA